MTTYQPRVIDAQLHHLIHGLPAIMLEGAKGVGKTSTAERISATTLRMEQAATRAIVAADRSEIGHAKHPVLLDEWQNDPEIWDTVRRFVDEGAPAGSFILTGSANHHDAHVHSGAGRIVSLRMRPMAFSERGIAKPAISLKALVEGTQATIRATTPMRLRDYVREIVDSGLPGIRRLPDEFKAEALTSYIRRALEHEVRALGLMTRRPDSLAAWLTAYAAATSTTASYTAIGDAVDSTARPSRNTAADFRDALSQLWLLDELPAWIPGAVSLGRLGRTPKHHLADPALAVALLGIDAEHLLGAQTLPDTNAAYRRLGDGPFLGSLFESLVALSIRVYAQPLGFQAGHLRLQGGEREIDLILHAPDGRVVAIETKLAEEVDAHDVRHLNWLESRLGERLVERIIVTTGTQSYRRADGVAVIPLALLGP